MKNFSTIILICLCSFSFAQSNYFPSSEDFQDGVIFFRLSDQYDISHIPLTADFSVDPTLLPELTSIFENYGIINLSRPLIAFNHPVLLRIFKIEFSRIMDIEMLIYELESKEDIIKYAEKNPIMKPLYNPNDPYYGIVDNGNFKWHLDKIYADGAWSIQQGNPNIKVAIVDNYVWGEHPDLGITSSNQYNAYTTTVGNSSPNYSQVPDSTSYAHSHGTHAAGLVGAINNNNTGIASIGSGVTLMGIRAANNNGTLWYTREGVSWAVKNGAKVINMSYGSTSSYSQTDADTYQAYADSGVVLVASAGNTGNEGNPTSYPAGYPSVISVASIDGDGKLSYFSQYGSTNADIAAPGGFINSSRSYPNILSSTFCESYLLPASYPSLSGTYYDGMQGTSMSSPMVAGLCGLLLSFDSTLTPSQIKSLLQETASPLNPESPTDIGGNGYVNAFAALMSLNAGIPIFKVSPGALNCPYEEHTDSLLIISNSNWTISDPPTWMSTTIKDYYETSKRLIVHVDKNFSISPRSHELTVYSADLDSTITITISQPAYPRTLLINRDTIRINREQNSISTLTITSNIHWSITGSEPGWLSINNTSGDTSAMVTFTANTTNTTGANLSSSFVLSGNGVPDTNLTVIQVFEDLFFSTNKETVTLTSSNRARDTLWITSNTDWMISGYDTSLVTITPTSGYGNGFVVIAAKTTNSGYVSLTTNAIFYLNGLPETPISISQKASDFLVLPETSFTLGAEEGSTVSVPVYSNVSWTVLSNSVPWVTPNISSGQDSMDIIFTAMETNSGTNTRSTNFNIRATFALRAITITQEFSNSIPNNETEAQLIRVYPNPTPDYITIQAGNNIMKEIQLMEVQGRIIQTISSIGQTQNVIDMSGLSAGIYFLQITLSNDTIVTKKIIKQ